MSNINLTITTIVALIVLFLCSCDKTGYYYIVGDCERIVVSSVPIYAPNYRPLLNPDECEKRNYGY